MPDWELERSIRINLDSIKNIFKKFIREEHLQGSQEALIDLAALEFVTVTDSALAFDIKTRELALSRKPFERLKTSYNAIDLLINSKTIDDYPLEIYLLTSLKTSLEKVVYSKDDEDKLIISKEFNENTVRLNNEILRLIALPTLNNFFKHLKALNETALRDESLTNLLENFFKHLEALNETALRDEGLTNLLEEVDNSKRLNVQFDELVTKIHFLREEISLYLAERSHVPAYKALLDDISKVNAIYRRNSTDFISLTETDSHTLTELSRKYSTKPIVQGNDADKINVENSPAGSTLSSASEDRKRLVLKALQELFADEVWDTQANGFGKKTPKGIKKIRSLLANRSLSVEERISRTFAIISERLNNSIDRRSLMVHQCYVELKLRIIEQFFSKTNFTNEKHITKGDIFKTVQDTIESSAEAMWDEINCISSMVKETALSLEATIGKIPVNNIRELFSEISGFLKDQDSDSTINDLTQLKTLLNQVSNITEDTAEHNLEILKGFTAVYLFLKNKHELSQNKSIKSSLDLFYSDLFTILHVVKNEFTKTGYQALLDKIHCHRDLSGKKLFAKLKNSKNNRVLSLPNVISAETLFPLSEKIKDAIRQAFEKLQTTSLLEQRWLDKELVETQSGKALLTLRKEVENIRKESYFTPTGIEQLNNLFKSLDAHPLGKNENQRLIMLLAGIRNRIENRLDQPIQRERSLQQFYIKTCLLVQDLEGEVEASSANKKETWEKMLIDFTHKVEHLYKQSTFPPTGIKQLMKAFFNENFYRREGRGDKESVIRLFRKCHQIIETRFQKNPLKRDSSIQLFYDNSRQVLGTLLNSEASTHFSSHSPAEEKKQRTETIFSDIQGNADQFIEKDEKEDECFEKLLNVFVDLKRSVNDHKWNDKGLGFFSSKTPETIFKLRTLLKGVASSPSHTNQPFIPFEKVKLMQLFMEVYATVKHSERINRKYRADSVHQLYKTVNKVFGSFYDSLEDTERNIFNFVHQNKDKPSRILASFQVPGLNNVFVNALAADKFSRFSDELAEKLNPQQQSNASNSFQK